MNAVDRLYEMRVEAEARTFELATHFADLHARESLPRGGDRERPGTERAVRLGGPGTPMVAEFAVAELGCRMLMGLGGQTLRRRCARRAAPGCR